MDIVLQMLASTSTKEGEKPLFITLAVNGFLLSGRVITREMWMEKADLKIGVPDLDLSSIESPPIVTGQFTNELPQFIHLTGAKYFSTGFNPVPMNEGVNVRVDLNAVTGFFFGQLSPEKQSKPV